MFRSRIFAATFCLLAIFQLLPSPVVGQNQAPQTSNDLYQRLIGDWDLSMRFLVKDDQGRMVSEQTATARSVCQVSHGGKFLTMSTVDDSEQLIVFCFDSTTRNYNAVEMHSDGKLIKYDCDWNVLAKTMTLKIANPAVRLPHFNTLVFRFIGDDEIKVTGTAVDPAASQIVEIREEYHRRPALVK